MAALPYFYSMVVDTQPLHPYKAHILLLTLERFGLVPRERIIVQCTERVPVAVRASFTRNGYTVRDIAPYLDKMHCNKIAQLDYFMGVIPAAEKAAGIGVFLLDLDLGVLSPLDVPNRQVVWGKIVDAPNPPLSTLQRIFSVAGVEPSEIVSCDWETGRTVATNFNGGVLYIPFTTATAVRTSWRRWAEFLFSRPELFDEPSQRRNIDQISFAMMTVSEKIPYRHLTANWNFSCHHLNRKPRTYDAKSPIHILHYHDFLDRYGLIAPTLNFSDSPIDSAVKQLNTALGEWNDPTFFDLYKRHCAEQVVDAIPSIRTSLFPKDFLARMHLNGTRRKLVLHAGATKTGTTSLQWYLDSQRVVLAGDGIWYPPSSHLKGKEPKHQRLVLVLMGADEAAFVECIQEALRDMPESAHTVILTTEGIYNHWRDYPPQAKGLLRHLADLFDFEMCVWFREPVSFATSLYAQYLTNPQMPGPQANVYGRDIGFEEAMRDNWFRGQLDFLGFYYEARALFGQDRVTPFLYSGNTIETFLAHYAVRQKRAVRMAEAARRENSGLSAAGVRLMRSVNRWRSRLTQPRQERVAAWVRSVDGVVGRLSPAFRLTEQQADLVNRYAGRGWAILQEKCRKSAASRRVAR